MTRRFFLYARKSTDDLSRQVRSIDDQIAELHSLALREGLDIAGEFVEKQTAKAPGRPVFNDMLERIEAGEAQGILAWHPDRLARNAVDGGKIIYLGDTGMVMAAASRRHLRSAMPDFPALAQRSASLCPPALAPAQNE